MERQLEKQHSAVKNIPGTFKATSNGLRQEPITRSVKLTYFRATALSQVRLFLDTPFPRISIQKPIRSGG